MNQRKQQIHRETPVAVIDDEPANESPEELKPKEMDNENLTLASKPATKHKSTLSVFLLVFVISFGSLFFGYAIGMMSLSADTVWIVFNVDSDSQKLYNSILSSILMFGAMIGSISSGLLLDSVSRKTAFLITDAITVASALLSQITNINVFIVARLVAGIATGLNSALVPMYIQEVAPLSISGQMGTVFQICVNAGIIIVTFFGQFFKENPVSTDEYWRFVFLFPIALGVGRAILITMFYNHETPFYYLLKSDKQSAIKFLSNMYQEEYVEEVCEAVQAQVDKVLASTETYSDMWKPNMLNRLVLACTLQAIQQFSGINAVIMYSGNIFKDNGYDFAMKNLLSLISNVVLMCAALGSGLVLNLYGRKTILLVGTTACAIFCGALALLSIINNDSLSMISVALIFAYYIAFNCSLGPIVWLYCSEILPGKGISIATAANWTGATIIVFLSGLFGVSVQFIIFGSVCVAGVFFMISFMKETKDKTKAEISLMFSKRGDEANLSSVSDSQKKYVD